MALNNIVEIVIRKKHFESANTQLQDIYDDLTEQQELYKSTKETMLNEWSGNAKDTAKEIIKDIEKSIKSCIKDFKNLQKSLNDISKTFEETDSLSMENIMGKDPLTSITDRFRR